MRLKLYRPVYGTKINQGFGQNLSCVTSTNTIITTKTDGECPANSIPFYKTQGMLGHNGLDVAIKHGENVYHCATFTGIMATAKDSWGGIGVDVISKEPIFFAEGDLPPEAKPFASSRVDENGIRGYGVYVKIRYWHLLTPVGWDGKEITPGTLIGLADNTGASSGDHLHWAPKWCDENGNGLATDNGYYGAFNPEPYYDHSMFIGDVLKVSPKLPAPTPLTQQEKQEISSQLTLIQKALLLLKLLVDKLFN